MSLTRDAAGVMLCAVPEAGLELGGTYRLTRPIGEGGMGQVWEAQHVRLPKRFAVKFLHAEALRDKDVFARFRREAEIASAIGNPHIVDVVDFNHDAQGVPYMVLEFLDGEDLAGRIERRGALPVDEAVAIAEQVAGALDAAHAKSIVHRDLKPQNIFLVRFEDRDDFVKVLDFGISKVLDSATVMTKTGAVFGTPNYMSPEQVDGLIAQIDGRTDVFALGAILYEMLAGKAAFDATTMSAVFNQVCHKEPEPLESIRGDVPESVTAVIKRALAKARDDRFASMADLRTALLGPAAARPRTGLPSGAPARPSAVPPKTTLRESSGQLPTLRADGKGRSKAPLIIGAGVVLAAAVAVVMLRGGSAPVPSDAAVAAVAPSGPGAVSPDPAGTIPAPSAPPSAPLAPAPTPAVSPTGAAAPIAPGRRHEKPRPGQVGPSGVEKPADTPPVEKPPEEKPALPPDAGAAQPEDAAAAQLRERIKQVGLAYQRRDYPEVIRLGRKVLETSPRQGSVLRQVGHAACASKDADTARWIHGQLSAPLQKGLAAACARQGITLP